MDEPVKKLYKLDLHTHSIISYDGGISAIQYKQVLAKQLLDCIAITDHNQTRFAQEMHTELGNRIIIGEEIMTADGEMIGLFLRQTVAPGLSAGQTAKKIREQGGLVYIPHPFEILRKGLKESVLQEIINYIDIVEVFNARAKWHDKSVRAVQFVRKNITAAAASSDSHCLPGLASSYSLVAEIPTTTNLVNLLRNGSVHKQYAPLYSYLCPSLNKIKKLI